MSEIIAEGMHNDQRVITVKSISGNPITLNEKIAEVVVDTGSGKQRCVAVKQFGGGGGGGGSVDDVQVNGVTVVTDGVANIPIAGVSTLGVVRCNTSDVNGVKITNEGVLTTAKASNSDIDSRTSVYKPVVPDNLDYAVRSVSPACTTITASNTTATLVANTTYAHQPATGCTYTLTTPTNSSSEYNGFILILETTNSASIAFQTDDTPATTISISGNPTIEVGKKYTVTGQYSPLSQEWQLFIISYETT